MYINCDAHKSVRYFVKIMKALKIGNVSCVCIYRSYVDGKLDYNTIKQKMNTPKCNQNTNVKKSMRSIKYSTDFQMKC